MSTRRFHGFNWKAHEASDKRIQADWGGRFRSEPTMAAAWSDHSERLARHAVLHEWAQEHLGPGTAIVSFYTDVDPDSGDYGYGGEWFSSGTRLTLYVDYLVDGLGDERGNAHTAMCTDEDASKHINEIFEALLSAGRKDA